MGESTSPTGRDMGSNKEVIEGEGRGKGVWRRKMDIQRVNQGHMIDIRKNTTRVSNRPRDIISLNDALRTRRRAPARVNLEGNLSCLVEAFSDAAVLDGGAL